jgi:hypothetical protein
LSVEALTFVTMSPLMPSSTSIAKRGGLFKERGRDLQCERQASDTETDEEVEMLRARVQAGSRRGSKNSTASKLSSKSRKKKKSNKQRQERRSSEQAESSELTPIQRVLQREATFDDFENEKESGETAPVESVAPLPSTAHQRLKLSKPCDSDASSVAMSESSMSSFASSASSFLRSEQQERHDRNRKTVGSSKKKNKTASPPMPTAPPALPSDSDSCSDTSVSSTVSQSLREQRQSLLSRIAEAKAVAEANVSELFKTMDSGKQTHGTRGVKTTPVASTNSNKRERIGGKNHRTVSEAEVDDSLIRYLERAVRSVGEQFQFGTMKVTPTDRRDEVGIAIAESGIGMLSDRKHNSAINVCFYRYFYFTK